MTSKEECRVLQCLMDYLGREYEATGQVPTTEQMYMYLLEGFDVVYEDGVLEELRQIFIEGENEDGN